MPESPRWKFIHEDNHYTLLIFEVQPEDAGTYACVSINASGKSTCTAKLIVDGNLKNLLFKFVFDSLSLLMCIFVYDCVNLFFLCIFILSRI